MSEAKNISNRASRRQGRRRLWCFRLVALFALPSVLLIGLEGALRFLAIGYRTEFLLPYEQHDQKVWIQNDRFGWRFFGRNHSRSPWAFSIDQKKPDNTIRVFVFGESAAFGDPDPAFGLPRVLDAMLSLRFPDTEFEVVNVSMTAINSHGVRDIARSCAKVESDIWVVYMGNNEVIGPFGSGTVFGPQVPPLNLIRASLALKSSRIGQAIEAVSERLVTVPTSKSEWGGMKMFLDQQVRLDDSRMERVYDHYEANLADIIQLGKTAGNGIVVCNVVSNLKDCAPFSSMNDPNLAEEERKRWLTLYEQGVALQSMGRYRAAQTEYDRAARIDSSMAALQFRRAQCALEGGDEATALQLFSLARDLDTLRFRADSRMAEIVRQVVSHFGNDQVRFADVETAFINQSPDRIPGHHYLYEHVHLNWDGNWLLAKTIADQLLGLLPERVARGPGRLENWPSAESCAKRLAWTDRSRRHGFSEILSRMADAPYTGQINYQEQLSYLKEMIEKGAGMRLTSELDLAIKITEEALSDAPTDPTLLAQLAEFRLEAGDLAGARSAAQRVVDLLPHAAAAWDRISGILARTGKMSEALEALEVALKLEPENVWMRHNLALGHRSQGRNDLAQQEWGRVISIKPRFGIAYLGLGQLLESQGKEQAAAEQYRLALANRILRSRELTILGRFCMKKGWLSAAVTNFQDAIKRDPYQSNLHLDLAQALDASGDRTQALFHYEVGARMDPSQLISQFQLGLEHARQGRPVEAAAHFIEVVRLNPGLVEGHLNLGVAYAKQGLESKALIEFDQVLQSRPNNTTALRYVQELRQASIDIDADEIVPE